MPIAKSSELFNLIKTLSKAEKRNFKLYATRNQNDSDFKFIDLFDVLDQLDQYDEKKILQMLKHTSKPQLVNLKRHLYSQILGSLRVIHVTKKPNIEVRELIDFAYILYDRALYIEAIKILNRAKKTAEKYHLNNMYLTILEFEKKIESRHITRSGKERATELIVASEAIRKKVSNTILLSNLRIHLHSSYIQNGHCQSTSEKPELEHFFRSNIQDIDEASLGLVEKVHLYQSYVWYFYILLDFESCLDYSEKWLTLLEGNPSMIERDVDLYLRAYHYVLSSCFHLKEKKKLTFFLERIGAYRKNNYKRFSELTKIISFQYVHTARLNDIILNGHFEKGRRVISRSLKRINAYHSKMDAHKILVFYFKIAWIYFGDGNYSKSMYYLNKIVNNELPQLRVDLQIYSRILFLMCHYEMSNFDVFQYSITSFKSYTNKLKDRYPIQEIIQKTFLDLAEAPQSKHKVFLNSALLQLQDLQKNSSHKVSFTYLDVISWLEAKIQNRSLAAVIRAKK